MLLGQISERVKRRDKMVISMEELPELEHIFREGARAQEEEARRIEGIKIRRMKEAIESS